MKKLCFSVVILLGLLSMAQATLVVWNSDNLLDSAPSKVSSASDGWLVMMYEDTDANNTDSWYNELVLDNSGGVTSLGDTQDDTYLNTVVTYLQYNPSGSTGEELQFGTSYSIADNTEVYTVIFNSSTIAGASEFVVADSSTFNSGTGFNPQPYQVSGIAGSWQAIPEPAVASLIGLFGVGLFVSKRIFRKD